VMIRYILRFSITNCSWTVIHGLFSKSEGVYHHHQGAKRYAHYKNIGKSLYAMLMIIQFK